MSLRRSTLFQTLRICFFANLVLTLFLIGFFIYLRCQRSKLLEIVDRQLSYNVILSRDLAHANFIITNHFFSAASSFVSNIVSSSVSNLPPSLVGVPVGPSSSVSVDSRPSDLPDLVFRGYFEVNGIPYIKLRNQCYKRGEFVLGYPIEDISSDIVLYRGKYYKVSDNEK